jgi:hypothetical protein
MSVARTSELQGKDGSEGGLATPGGVSLLAFVGAHFTTFLFNFLCDGARER